MLLKRLANSLFLILFISYTYIRMKKKRQIVICFPDGSQKIIYARDKLRAAMEYQTACSRYWEAESIYVLDDEGEYCDPSEL